MFLKSKLSLEAVSRRSVNHEHLGKILTVFPECYIVEPIQVLYEGSLCSTVSMSLNASSAELRTLSRFNGGDIMKSRLATFNANLYKALDTERNVRLNLFV